jgi:formate dehydrogenase subunit beta
MDTQWFLKTGGDPLGRVRGFLGALWRSAGLAEMVVPVCRDAQAAPRPEFLTDPALLASADPFAPLMVVNNAAEVGRRAQAGVRARTAAVLRPCEIRALQELARRRGFSLDAFLIVGVDCLATFQPEAYERRAREMGGTEELTREALLFARQGGILLYRNRPTCQRCGAPLAAAVDLCLGLHGLAAGEAVLVTARDEATAARLHLDAITDGPAPSGLIADHTRMAAALAARRARTRARMEEKLGPSLRSVEELASHILACAPCRACLDACPLYAGELEPGRAEDLAAWLAGCAGCGMCEQACPNHIPLPAVIDRIRRGLPGAAGAPSPLSAETTLCWL